MTGVQTCALPIYIGDGKGAKLYTYPQYDFPHGEWINVNDKEGEIILQQYQGFVKKEKIKKEDNKDGIISN